MLIFLELSLRLVLVFNFGYILLDVVGLVVQLAEPLPQLRPLVLAALQGFQSLLLLAL